MFWFMKAVENDVSEPAVITSQTFQGILVPSPWKMHATPLVKTLRVIYKNLKIAQALNQLQFKRIFKYPE